MAYGTEKTYEQLTLGSFLEPTSTALDHRAKIFHSLVTDKDLKETEVLSLDKYLDLSAKSLKKCDPNGLSMRMLRECFRATEEKIISQFSMKWTGGGTMRNGVLSTAKTTSHRTESESILLDILEPTVEKKYFLSKEQMEKIVFQ